MSLPPRQESSDGRKATEPAPVRHQLQSGARKLVAMLVSAALACAAVATNTLVDWVAKQYLGSDWTDGLGRVPAAGFRICFAAVALVELWSMLAVFIPRLESTRRRVVEGR